VLEKPKHWTGWKGKEWCWVNDMQLSSQEAFI